MENALRLSLLNRDEALRYLGYKGNKPDQNVAKILDECEEELLQIARPQYVYRCFDIREVKGGIAVGNTNLILTGESICEHLKGCNKAVLLCATISSDVDKRLRVLEIEDTAKMLIMDSLASVAVEQVCEIAEKEIAQVVGGNQTWRFGIGYGDLPLHLQGDFLKALDAPKRVGVCVTKSFLLTPRKSVTCIIGVSDKPLEKKKRGCATCNMNKSCPYSGKELGCGR